MIVIWSSLSQIIEENLDLGRRYKTLDGKYWDSVDKISYDLIFVHLNMSASTCVKSIAYIMNMYNMPEQAVEIILK